MNRYISKCKSTLLVIVVSAGLVAPAHAGDWRSWFNSLSSRHALYAASACVVAGLSYLAYRMFRTKTVQIEAHRQPVKSLTIDEQNAAQQKILAQKRAAQEWAQNVKAEDIMEVHAMLRLFLMLPGYTESKKSVYKDVVTRMTDNERQAAVKVLEDRKEQLDQERAKKREQEEQEKNAQRQKRVNARRGQQQRLPIEVTEAQFNWNEIE